MIHLSSRRSFLPQSSSFATLLMMLLITAVSCDTGSVAEPPDPKDCQQGLANNTYPCSNVNLLAFVSLEEMGETDQDANDIWGWTDSKTGREYALLGLTDGVAIFDITDGEKPVYVGKLPEPDKIVPRNILAGAADTAGESELAATAAISGAAPEFAYHDDQDSSGKGAAAWRDIKTYRNTMYVVSDESGRGMQVYDLEKLRDIPASAMPATLQHDAHYDLFGNAHNIAINEESGYAYVIGSYRGGTCASNGGLHIIDIRDRLNPQYAGCHVETTAGGYIRAGYIHDTQCVIYNGPDAAYKGREICVSSAEKRLLISDVTDKANPKTVAVYLYPGNRYAHQGWLTENHRTFFLNDELDELQNEHNTRTYILDLSDLDSPVFTGYVQHSTNSIDHNLYVRGNRMYQSNYMAGLRIFDITTPTPAGIKEAGFFDTTPAVTEKEFEGTWSVYPWFTKGKVALSDIHQGFFVLEYIP